MAKKKKETTTRTIADGAFDAFKGINPLIGLDMDSLREESENALNAMSEDEIDRFQAMLHLAMSGVTPEEYEGFYRIYEISGALVDQMGIGEREETDDFFPNDFGSIRRSRSNVKEYEPLKDAEDKTLVLKIQMDSVTKPPMWRNVEIPADYDFMQLHEVIQAVTGLENCHLWQFNKNAYDSALQIGPSMDYANPFGSMNDNTHDADDTPRTQFLQQKNDKLEYVYDFGDDWIFEIKVKDVLQKKIDNPVCTKFKSELNALEDFGGIGAYLSAREDLEFWGKMTKQERKQRFESHGFDSEEEYLEFLNSNRFSIDDINEYLKSL